MSNFLKKVESGKPKTQGNQHYHHPLTDDEGMKPIGEDEEMEDEEVKDSI